MVARIAGYTCDSVDVDSCGLQGINRKMKLASRNWRVHALPESIWNANLNLLPKILAKIQVGARSATPPASRLMSRKPRINGVV